MADPVLEELILQLVEWISNGEQSYDSVMSAWRTSCPRLQVWEEACDRGLIKTEYAQGSIVRITPVGVRFLEQTKDDAQGTT